MQPSREAAAALKYEWDIFIMREFLQYFSVKAYSLPQRFEFYLKKAMK